MQKEALANGILSFIIPGLGQGLHGNAKKGIVLFIGMLAIHAATYYLANNAAGSLISTAYHLYAGYDAYINY
ncbi:hypothetical protein [Methanobrevibacter sp.]|uniref:hypothetical protein n=1 Tax=Methanobrevibacter sp. TaxID=66852 RepID=UPI0038674335